MIITFGTQKGGTGKTTLGIAFANYLSQYKGKKVKVYDFDFQKSFYHRWKSDEKDTEKPPIYDVEILDDDNYENIISIETLQDMSSSEDIFLIDLAGTLDEKYVDILMYSDVIVIPFEYSNISAESTIVFNNFLGMIDSQAVKIFLRSKYDKGFDYPNQKGMDEILADYGVLLQNSVFKRNCLQTINTRKLNYEQKKAVEKAFEEIIEKIDETLQITI